MTAMSDTTIGKLSAHDAAQRWKAEWERHWAAGTLREVLPLYAEDAVFRAFMHRDGDIGHEAMGTTFDTFQAAARDLQCWFGEPLVSGSRAVVEWWSTWMEDGAAMSMAGMSKLWFDDAGLVVESRDYWNSVHGASSPFEGWERPAE